MRTKNMLYEFFKAEKYFAITHNYGVAYQVVLVSYI